MAADKHRPRYIVCARVADGPSVVPAETRFCKDCSAPVWISKNTLRVAAGEGMPICIPCVIEREADSNAPMEAEYPDPIMREVADTLGRDISQAERDGVTRLFGLAAAARRLQKERGGK